MRALLPTGLLFCLVATVGAADEVDLTNVPKKIVKQPSYQTEQPLYALAVFGKEAKTHVWMVLDQSKAGDGPYDVLHVDLNGNGDLTDDGESIKAKTASGTREATSANFELGDFTDRHTKAKHTELKLRISGGGSRPLHMLNLKWRGEHKIGGGYAEQSAGGYMRFAASVKEAPLVWFNGDGPFRFQRWYSEELRIGGADDLKLFLGQQGLGKNTFCAFQGHVLPAGEGVKATLIYKDKDGKTKEGEPELLKERC